MPQFAQTKIDVDNFGGFEVRNHRTTPGRGLLQVEGYSRLTTVDTNNSCGGNYHQ